MDDPIIPPWRAQFSNPLLTNGARARQCQCMSGSGSGGSGIGYGGEPEAVGQRSCYDFVERVRVSSPDPEVAREVEVGNVLDVTVDSEETPLLLLATPTGRILGSIVPSGMARLLVCILNEHVHFMAVVLEKNGGLIRVEIRAKE